MEIRRPTEHGLLSSLLARGRADETTMRRIASELVRFHSAAAPTRFSTDEIQAIADRWSRTLAAISAPMDGHFQRASFRAITELGERFLTENVSLLRSRIVANRIGARHGNLYADQIVVARRQVRFLGPSHRLTDETNADVAADVAQFAVDLDHRGHADLAIVFAAAYVRLSGDSELGAVLGFYKCLEALRRADPAESVAITKCNPTQSVTREREHHSYLDLAWVYAGGLERPLLVVTAGPPRVVRGQVAHNLAEQLGLVHLRLANGPPSAPGCNGTTWPVTPAEPEWNPPVEPRRCYAETRRRVARWLRHGQSVVVEGTYGRHEDRAALRRVAITAGARFLLVVCHGDEAHTQNAPARPGHVISVNRAGRPTTRPAPRATIVESAPTPWLVTIDTTRPIAETVEQILSTIRGPLPNEHHYPTVHETFTARNPDGNPQSGSLVKRQPKRGPDASGPG
ncbi:MAG: AAA family ATPase [Chloroflexi bacterium]|nr:AAA family ATPase [Chloroflexota bacterium]